MVVNPSPYPAHAIPAEKCVYVPAATPETMKATVMLLQTGKLRDMKSVKKYVANLVRRCVYPTDTFVV